MEQLYVQVVQLWSWRKLAVVQVVTPLLLQAGAAPLKAAQALLSAVPALQQVAPGAAVTQA